MLRPSITISPGLVIDGSFRRAVAWLHCPPTARRSLSGKPRLLCRFASSQASGGRASAAAGPNTAPPRLIDRAIDEETLPSYRTTDFHPTGPGHLLNGAYRTITKIGYGAGSTVWLAEDVRWCVKLRRHHSFQGANQAGMTFVGLNTPTSDLDTSLSRLPPRARAVSAQLDESWRLAILLLPNMPHILARAS